MKLITRFLLNSLFLLALVAKAEAAPPEILKLVANEWEPYTGEQLKNKGLATELVTTALRRSGYDIVVTIVPWSRALKGVEAGTYDGIIAVWMNDERKKSMLYSTPYMTNDVVLFRQLKNNISYNSFADLEKWTIGTIRDYAYGDAFDQSTRLKKKAAMDLRTNVVRLTKGIIDLFPEDRYVMRHILNKNYPEYVDKIGHLDKPLSQRTLHMAISRKTQGFEKIVSDFNRELAAIRAEGLFEKMIKKHNLAN